MLRSEWEKRPWMARLGAIPIDPNSPAQLLHFFRTLKTKRLKTGLLTCAYFFEGEMSQPGTAWLPPKRGTELVVRQLQPVWVLPVALTLDNRYHSKTCAYVNSGSPVLVSDLQDISPLIEKIKTLSSTTLLETTEVKENFEKMYAKGWANLW